MTEIPPLVIAPDEAARELVRNMLVEQEVAGRPEKAYPIAREALWGAWEEIDRLRAALAAQGPKEEG